jgi:hypothetical protein
MITPLARVVHLGETFRADEAIGRHAQAGGPRVETVSDEEVSIAFDSRVADERRGGPSLSGSALWRAAG